MAGTFTVTASVERSKTYLLRLRARNAWGWGAYSTETAIKAAAAPLVMTAITSTVDSVTGNFVISWVEPDTNGDPITAYTIEI